VATLPDGTPYVVGRPPAPFPHWVPCAACKRKTSITLADYNRLPELSIAELEAMGLKPTQHLEGAGWTKAQAADIYPHAAGPAELEALLSGVQSQADTKAGAGARLEARRAALENAEATKRGRLKARKPRKRR
jgi:hypothetical protein